MAPPTVALCVIAKDEERFLPGCLASVEGAVDQRIVVDTGSTDRTVALAEAAGATVVHHTWRHDFAAARNAALPHVTCDWILVLDADERLAPGQAAAVRQVVAAADYHCGLLRLHNATHVEAPPDAVLSGAARIGEPTNLPRLLRRDPELRWERPIHESVGAWLGRGRRARALDLDLIHYGDVPEIRAARGKAQRNRDLLAARCEAAPKDTVARTYWARELVRNGEPARARVEAARAWSDLVAQCGSAGPHPDPVPTLTLHAWLCLTAGQPQTALAELQRGARWCGGHPNVALLTAVAAAEQPSPPAKLLQSSIRELRGLLAAPRRSWAAETLPGATGWAGWTALGDLLMIAGQPGAAAAAYQQARTHRPDHQPALLGLAEARATIGQPEAALSVLQPILGTPGCPADAWMIAALATWRLRDASAARGLLLRTRDAPWRHGARARRAAALAQQLSGR